MNPEHVASLLRDTQQEWANFALNEKVDVAQKSMVESCAVVAQGMVDGSDGDKDRVEEYFEEVCSVGKSGEQESCRNFAHGLLSFLTNDPEANRNSLDARKFCTQFWVDHMGSYVRAAESRRAVEAEEKKKEYEQMMAEKKRTLQLAKERAQAEAKRQNEMRLATTIKQAAKNAEQSQEKVTTIVEKAVEEKANSLMNKMQDIKKSIKKITAENTAEQAAETKDTSKKTKENKQAVQKGAPAAAEPATIGQMAMHQVQKFISYFTHNTEAGQKGRATTMADIFRKESSYMMASHQVRRFKRSFFHQQERASAVKKTARSAKHAKSAEEIKAEAKAVVARKVDAIKKRIAKKFAAKASAK